MPYRLLQHTADLGIEVWALSREELFVEAAKALFAEVIDDLSTVEPRVSRDIVLDQCDDSLVDMFKDWLSELVYIMDTEGLVFSDFDVRIENGKLEAVARGEKLSPKRHRLKRAVKSVTYHRLSVKEEAWGWVATVILDI